MATKTPRYAGNLQPGTYRGPSSPVWFDCPVSDFKEDPSLGQYFYEEFNMVGNANMSSAYQGSAGAWSIYGAAGATITDGALEGGVVSLQSDGDNEGITLLSSASSFKIVGGTPFPLSPKLWYECSVATTTVTATKRDDFVGLVIPALSSGLPRANYPITTTDDTLDATNGTFIGFHRKGTAAPTEWQFVFNLAGGTINYVQNLTTLMATAQTTVNGSVPFGGPTPATISPMVANQFVKLAFVFDPNYRVKTIPSLNTARQTVGARKKALLRVFVNGIELPTFLTSDDIQNATATQAFPTAFMAPCVATMNQTATTPGSLLCDFVGVAQFANS